MRYQSFINNTDELTLTSWYVVCSLSCTLIVIFRHYLRGQARISLADFPPVPGSSSVTTESERATSGIWSRKLVARPRFPAIVPTDREPGTGYHAPNSVKRKSFTLLCYFAEELGQAPPGPSTQRLPNKLKVEFSFFQFPSIYSICLLPKVSLTYYFKCSIKVCVFPRVFDNNSLCKICRAHGDRVFLSLNFQEGVK